MKCLIIGFGSAGQRHARILKEMGHEVAVVSGRGLKAGADRWYASVPLAMDAFEPDYAIIASATSHHHGDMKRAVQWGWNRRLLIEKPLFHECAQPPMNSGLLEQCAVGYNLRFHPVVRELRDRIMGRELY